MAKKQTRRSVSIRGTTYDLIREHCETSGISMSEFVEDRIASFFGPAVAAERPQPQALKPAAAKPVAARPAPAGPASGGNNGAGKSAASKEASGKSAKAQRPARSNGSQEEKLSFDELQDAARFFTF